MVLPGPVQDGIRYVIVRHGPPCRDVVAAAGAVGQLSVLPPAVVIARSRPLQPGIPSVGVVVHHIHHHPQARPVQRLDHLLALPDPHRSVTGVRGIGALGHIVVHWVVAPVELPSIPRLVHRPVVEEGEQVHMGHAQALQIRHAGKGRAVGRTQSSLGTQASCSTRGICGMRAAPRASRPDALHRERLVLPPESFRHPAVRVVGEILDVQLVDDALPAFLRGRIRRKARRIRQRQVHHHAPCPIAAAAHSVGVGCPPVLSLRPYYIIVIHPVKALRKFQRPDSPVLRLQLLLQPGFGRAAMVQPQLHPLRHGAPHLEYGAPVPADRSQVFPVIPISFVKFPAVGQSPVPLHIVCQSSFLLIPARLHAVRPVPVLRAAAAFPMAPRATAPQAMAVRPSMRPLQAVRSSRTDSIRPVPALSPVYITPPAKSIAAPHP